MPRLNQTGPTGQGSMTGHKMGRCTNSSTKPENQASTTTESSKATIPENIKGEVFGFGRRRGRYFGRRQQNHFIHRISR